jgi:aspartate kinase
MSKMNVFKFGGASVNSVERIKNLASIVKEYKGRKLMVIISAMGKTTNALEKVTEAFYAGRKEEAFQLFEIVKKQHVNTSKYLLVTHFNQCLTQLTDFFTEIEWLLYDNPVKEYDFYYDQIVCIGELLSTAIISHYLNEININNTWIDVRDIIRTNNNFREAEIDWERTTAAVHNQKINESASIFITQGFIGATDENESTTLGREGSDYTAAVFANILNAESLTIWKDVEGVMNADPKQFPDAKTISELSFDEIIEMAYYGAQVIHPKTIKPLQNKNIPLFVKCFSNPLLNGTVIHKKNSKEIPPIIVIKQKQILVLLKSQDYSFVGEKLMSDLYSMFSTIKLTPGLIQTGAISIQICLDDFHPNKTEKFASLASTVFDVQIEKGLTLLTIRHYTESIIEEMSGNKEVVLMQKTKETIQVLYK